MKLLKIAALFISLFALVPNQIEAQCVADEFTSCWNTLDLDCCENGDSYCLKEAVIKPS